VVANGTEGEPISGKDKVLVRYLPHLVLDGAVAAAQTLGAREAIVAVSRADREGLDALSAAIAERRALDKRVRLRAVAVPDGFVAGEETALVNFLNRGVAKPTFTPPLPFERGVGKAPTLVQNVETLAQLALIARFGSDWFRTVGTADEPGSALVTISGSVAEPGVYEVALGAPLRELVALAGGVTEHVSAFLVGGYFGSWLGEREAADASLLEADLRPRGARLGARAIVVLPTSACGICETARAIRYLADSSAGQCGPCVYGLDAIARSFERLAARQRLDERKQLGRWIQQVRGRGACSHPDGAAGFATSALQVFAHEADQHLRGRCQGKRQVLPTPAVAR
jgi:NADH:ubiquinone oxidoreductase subunit F (NADH-binding)